MSYLSISQNSLGYIMITNNLQILTAYDNQGLLSNATHPSWVSRSVLCAPYSDTQVDRATIFAAAAKSLQLWPTLCDPIDGSPPGSAIPGILQARILGWVAISFSNAWEWKVKVKSLSRVWLLVTPWTAAYQAPPSMGFSRQEYWSGLPLSSLNNLCKHHQLSR